MVHSLERKNEMKNIGNIKMIFFLGYALGIYVVLFNQTYDKCNQFGIFYYKLGLFTLTYLMTLIILIHEVFIFLISIHV